MKTIISISKKLNNVELEILLIRKNTSWCDLLKSKKKKSSHFRRSDFSPPRTGHRILGGNCPWPSKIKPATERPTERKANSCTLPPQLSPRIIAYQLTFSLLRSKQGRESPVKSSVDDSNVRKY